MNSLSHDDRTPQSRSPILFFTIAIAMVILPGTLSSAAAQAEKDNASERETAPANVDGESKRSTANRSIPDGTSKDAASLLINANKKTGLVINGLRSLLQQDLKRVLTGVDNSELIYDDKISLKQKIRNSEAAIYDALNRAMAIQNIFQKTGEIFEVASEIDNILSTAHTLKIYGGGGALASNLIGLSKALQKYGGKVPLLGTALEKYGEITEKLLGALGDLSSKITELKYQNRIGAGTSASSSRCNQVLWDNHREIWKQHTYSPRGPGYAYLPFETNTPLLLWDEPADTWYIIDRNVRFKLVYGDNLTIGRKLTAPDLRDYLEKSRYKKIMADRDIGLRIARFLTRSNELMPFGSQNVIDMYHAWKTVRSYYEKHCWFASRPDEFTAHFTFDPSFKSKVWTLLEKLFYGLSDRKRFDLAEKLRTQAIEWGCEDAQNWFYGIKLVFRCGESIPVKESSSNYGCTLSCSYYLIFTRKHGSDQLSISIENLVPKNDDQIHSGQIKLTLMEVDNWKNSQTFLPRFFVKLHVSGQATWNSIDQNLSNEIHLHSGSNEEDANVGGSLIKDLSTLSSCAEASVLLKNLKSVTFSPKSASTSFGKKGDGDTAKKGDNTPAKPKVKLLMVTTYAGQKKPGKEVAGATVTARLRGGAARRAVSGTTRAAGWAALTLPGPGTYDVVARSRKLGEEQTTVAVGDHSPVELALVFKGGDTEPGDHPGPDTGPVMPTPPDDTAFDITDPDMMPDDPVTPDDHIDPDGDPDAAPDDNHVVPDGFDPDNKPGWIHCTRRMTVPRLQKDPTKTTVFLAEIWAEPKAGGKLVGTGTYRYLQDLGDEGYKGSTSFSATGTISGDRVSIRGPATFNVQSWGYKQKGTIPFHVRPALSTFTGTLKDNVYAPGPIMDGKERILTRIVRCGEDEPDTGPDDDTDDQPVAGSFAGDWKVAFYGSGKIDGKPKNWVRWKISVTGSRAVARPQHDTRLIRGPLSAGGRVWNAKMVQGGIVVMQFKDLRLSRDGKRFKGFWGGNVMHNNAIVGVRVGSTPVGGDTPGPKTPAQVTVELKHGGEKSCRVAPGGTVAVKVAHYAGTGYGKPKLTAVNGPLTHAGTATEPMKRTSSGGRMIAGAGKWSVFRFRAGSRPGTGRLTIEKRRSWEHKAIRYRVTVTVTR